MRRHPQSEIRNPKSAFTLVELPAVSGRKTTVRGFTLVELMTVIAIIAILAGLVLGVSGYATKKADKSRAIAQMEKLKNALEEYRMNRGSYPEDSGGSFPMDASVSNRLAEGLPANFDWADIAPKDPLRDPWDNLFLYDLQGKYSYRMWSKGPDSQTTGDDIDSSQGGM